MSGLEPFHGSDFETILYAGYEQPLSVLTVDVGLAWYLYPGTKGTDFAEPYASLSGTLGPATLTIGTAYSLGQDVSALQRRDNLYVYGNGEVALIGTPITLKTHLGYSTGGTMLSPVGNNLDWSLGAVVVLRNFSVGVSYVDTNILMNDGRSRAMSESLADATVVLTLGTTF